MAQQFSQNHLNPRVRGWLRHLWRKATTEDDWSPDGKPHPWWDRYSLEPMLSFPRFDLSESSYALLLMARKTPAWREVYTRIMDDLIKRHTTHWAAVDWLTQMGNDPQRGNYPKRYKRLMPSDLWGQYDVPGWTANGTEPWGLQPDPIGSDGNLFFRGFFTLMLGIHRAISGQDTWEQPFEVAGVDRQSFSWTHSGISTFLSEQWQRVPQGPHCENTKTWPYCLSAAALGLQMTDLTTGSSHHGICQQWSEDFLRKKYMGFDARGNLKWIAMYYDQLLDRVHKTNRAMGLAVAFYLLPQNRELAEILYRSGVAAVGWDKRWLPTITPPGGEPRMLSIACLLAREFGDTTTERRVGRKLHKLENGRFFDGAGGDAEDEFGYYFRYGEDWPRGQESALLMLRDLLDGEGDWWRSCNEYDTEKFTAPTVEGVQYPSLGLSAAWNDQASGNLNLSTFAASRNSQGASTSFRVTGLPDSASVSVVRGGEKYENWRALDQNTIEVETDIAEHDFCIHTGFRAGASIATNHPAGASTASQPAGGVIAQRVRLKPADLLSARASLGKSGCPCCA